MKQEEAKKNLKKRINFSKKGKVKKKFPEF
jgi:hypothetical protein